MAIKRVTLHQLQFDKCGRLTPDLYTALEYVEVEDALKIGEWEGWLLEEDRHLCKACRGMEEMGLL